MSNIEQTLSIIKPDAVERNLEGEIKEMFKSNGFQILKEKKIQIEKAEALTAAVIDETPGTGTILIPKLIHSFKSI